VQSKSGSTYLVPGRRVQLAMGALISLFGILTLPLGLAGQIDQLVMGTIMIVLGIVIAWTSGPLHVEVDDENLLFKLNYPAILPKVALRDIEFVDEVHAIEPRWIAARRVGMGSMLGRRLAIHRSHGGLFDAWGKVILFEVEDKERFLSDLAARGVSVHTS